MKYKNNVGDRIHVTKIDGSKVDFECTIYSLENYLEKDGYYKFIRIKDCSDELHDECILYTHEFMKEYWGSDKDAYELVKKKKVYIN